MRLIALLHTVLKRALLVKTAHHFWLGVEVDRVGLQDEASQDGGPAQFVEGDAADGLSIFRDLLLEHLQLGERKLRLLLVLIYVVLLGFVFNNYTCRLDRRYF